MWEYKRKDITYHNNDELTKILNEEGIENWEIIFYQEEKQESYNRHLNVKVLFKRFKTQ